MGIKKYTNNITSRFSNITFKANPDIQTVCIDLNSILHVCINSKNNEVFKKTLINKLNMLLKKMKPSRLALFTDGQAVLAKAKLQKERRDKYLYKSSIGSLNLTPGTEFMDFVDKIVQEYLDKLEIETHYSPSTEYNEGELKLFSWIKENKVYENVCIVGNDADLIVLALINTPLLKAYIYNFHNYLSLFKLVQKLSEIYTKKYDYKYHPVRKDFALLAILQGNDYVKNIGTFNNLFNAYTQNKLFLIKKNGDLDLVNFKKMLNKIPIKDNILYEHEQVNDYISCLQWNLDLYNGIIVSNYIPTYKNINVKSILKYIPEITKVPPTPNWINNDAYLLLLMPSVGKHLVPKHLRCLMEDSSPIKDLFPKPCEECIEWKLKIKNLVIPNNDTEKEEYKKLAYFINNGYAIHRGKIHPYNGLQINRIYEALDLL